MILAVVESSQGHPMESHPRTVNHVIELNVKFAQENMQGEVE